jgi:DNA-binding CsgD family transcriptional regulator
MLNWVGEGKFNLNIVAIPGLSHDTFTFKIHLERIFNKMGVMANSQAVQL